MQREVKFVNDPDKKGGGGISRVLNILVTAVLALLVCFLAVKIFFVTWVEVDQTSMSPTYSDGETVFVNRLGGVERGEVVVFYDADVSAPRLASAFGWFAGDAKLLIKRVIATEGDKLWLEEGADGSYSLKIGRADTGEAVGEEYYADGVRVEIPAFEYTAASAGVLLGTSRWSPYTVAEGCVFVMGDNRPNSEDSRSFGAVPLSRIIGTALN